jgi:tetratricopeptide (TPR) repeat protein
VSAIAQDSEVGIDGEIDIRAPVTDISGAVAPLPQNFAQAAALYQRCAEQLREGKTHSFVLAGHDDMPGEPSGMLPGTPYQLEVQATGERGAYQTLQQSREAFRKKQYAESRATLDEALQQARSLDHSPYKAYILTDIGLAYSDLRPHLSEANADLFQMAVRTLQEAGSIAKTNDTQQVDSYVQAASYAQGYLGALYEEAHRYYEALQLTRRAVFDAQKVQASESLYRWQWQTGSLLRALGDINAAMAAYQRAVATVQAIRPTLIRSYRRSFREGPGRLYFEYADLLLKRAASLETWEREAVYPQYEFYLEQARTIVERFKLDFVHLGYEALSINTLSFDPVPGFFNIG